MKKNFLYAFCAIALLSCNNNDFEGNLNETIPKEVEASNKSYSNSELKKEFGFALAKALQESQDLRSLIKTEALKKINYDYDVLYGLIRFEHLSDGQTVEELMSKYISASNLKTILDKIPTLTIFVPSLPDNSFSAEKWNIDTEIPVVAIRTTETNDVPILDASGEEWILEAQYTPISPTVVVKENERISSSKKEGNSLRSTSGSNLSLFFIDDVFNNEKNNSVETRALAESSNMNKVIEAYNIFKGTNNWHRDYIYYNLTTTKTKGVINKNVIEHIVGFELVNPNGSNDATPVINKICDQTGDPMPNGNTRGGSNCWTDGELEFKVKCSVASTTGIGSEIVKYMRFKPSDLFTPVKDNSGGSRNTWRYIARKFTLNENILVNLPLFEWNLETISPSIKISIEEVDSQETIKQNNSVTTEFATNFEYNLTTGETTKIGFKFGASAKKTMTVLYESTITKGNDELGDVVVNFGDDVITGYTLYNGKYLFDYNTKYNSGWYRIYLAPKEL